MHLTDLKSLRLCGHAYYFNIILYGHIVDDCIATLHKILMFCFISLNTTLGAASIERLEEVHCNLTRNTSGNFIKIKWKRLSNLSNISVARKILIEWNCPKSCLHQTVSTLI